MNLILRRFNMNYINDNSVILILGAQKSGKSFLSKDLLYHKKNISTGMVISNKYSNKNTYNYIPSLFIHDELNNDFIKKFTKKQLKLASSYNNDDTRKFLIFDDSIKYENIKDNKYLRKIISSPFEVNILCIIETIILEDVYNILISKNKVDYIFILKDNIQYNRKKIYDSIKNDVNIEFLLFCKLLDDYTDNFNCLVFHVKSKSKNFQDKLFWYKASVYENFNIGSDELWKYNNKHLIIE